MGSTDSGHSPGNLAVCHCGSRMARDRYHVLSLCQNAGKTEAIQPGILKSPSLEAALTAAKSLQGATPEPAKQATGQLIENLKKFRTEHPERAAEVDKLIPDASAIIANGKIDESLLKTLLLRLENMRSGTGTPAEALDLLRAQQELQKAYADSVNQTREFWKSMAQMILINLLLPTLTGLLGYVFASKANDKA
ncbi:hypothetical protein [Massilia sp. BJB1822]|uniref:hypothetical protein n=1 Tax=Massilia sp. BJB1822 TaxID=2744470 RepID=UPI00159311DD|nr:hypothetical protein [Massilia sp. BJB1822]NVD99391.1 hypothetical protein [Massilia sp. BJB1822]